jgi:molybdopterin-guanine dinucleotide biosynthesis protein A
VRCEKIKGPDKMNTETQTSENPARQPPQVGGIVLAGGQSRRMGRSKALLPFGQELMLPRILRLLGEIVQPLVVVAAEDQQLPPLPEDVALVFDRQPGRGPLEGLRVGLSAIGQRAEAAYVTACDVPLLQRGFVEFLIERLGDNEVVVPVQDKFHHPLAAVYRTSVVPHLDVLLESQQLRPVFLYQAVRTLRIPVDQLRNVDPHLHTLANLNRPEDYRAALESAGLEVPSGLDSGK